MSNILHDSAPDFSQPIAVLKHCHDRIRAQLATLTRLAEHLPRHGSDADAQKAAAAVLRYFNTAAELHHADEEDDLLPMLQATAQGEDAALLATTVPQILAQHVRMQAAWRHLALPLDAIARGEAMALPAHEVQAFAQAYTDHMTIEEGHIAPMAKRVFDAAQMAQLGAAMRTRRGIAA